MHWGQNLLSTVALFVLSTANDVESWCTAASDTDSRYMPLLRQADVDNHNIVEGGLWVVSGSHVYDVAHLREEFSTQQVERCIRKLPC